MEISVSQTKETRELAAISELEFKDSFVIDRARFPRLFKAASKCTDLEEFILSKIFYFEGPYQGQHRHLRERNFSSEYIISTYQDNWTRVCSNKGDFYYSFKDSLRKNKISFTPEIYNEFIRLIFERCNFAEYLPKEEWPDYL